MLSGRLGLETARIPHADRHGLLWLSRGHLHAEDGTLSFVAAGSPELEPGRYGIPFQGVSLVLLGPGTTISHDALRLLARHGTGLAAVGADGVRFYTAPPLMPDASRLARKQALLWADARGGRMHVARRMYARRLGELLPHWDIEAMRGVEGARMKATYKLLAQRYRIEWRGRRYDRGNPDGADAPNQAINHAATAIEAAAHVAVAATATLPQLGFIHEDSSNAFVLDVADLYRDSVTLPVAFQAVHLAREQPEQPLERHVRRLAGRTLRDSGIIPAMIDTIKELLDADDDGGDT